MSSRDTDLPEIQHCKLAPFQPRIYTKDVWKLDLFFSFPFQEPVVGGFILTTVPARLTWELVIHCRVDSSPPWPAAESHQE